MQPNDDDERSENRSVTNTRRQFVAGSAGLVGGLAAGGGLAGSALAQEDETETETETETPSGDETPEEPAESEFEDDVAILNYALTLEYLEASFYKEGLGNIGEEDLLNCSVFGDEDDPLRERAFDELRTIQQHEEAHVEALVSAIEDLGGEPVEEPDFDFGLRTEYPMVFLATAAQLEDVGVAAYAGAAPYIENEELLPPALSIHSVEARHASFLRTLTDETGFPDAFDAPLSKSEVMEMITPFIVGEGDETAGPDDEMGTETETENGTETETATETETPTETETANETETETPTETGVTTDNETSTPTDNGTTSPAPNASET